MFIVTEYAALMKKLYMGYKLPLFYLYQKLNNIKLTWFLRGIMDIFHVYFSNQWFFIGNKILLIVVKQQRLRRGCAYAQTRKSLCC